MNNRKIQCIANEIYWFYFVENKLRWEKEQDEWEYEKEIEKTDMNHVLV